VEVFLRGGGMFKEAAALFTSGALSSGALSSGAFSPSKSQSPHKSLSSTTNSAFYKPQGAGDPFTADFSVSNGDAFDKMRKSEFSKAIGGNASILGNFNSKENSKKLKTLIIN
jgi:hypothetical protein